MLCKDLAACSYPNRCWILSTSYMLSRKRLMYIEKVTHVSFVP